MAGRAPGLEALISAQALNENLESAQIALDELSRTAMALGTDPLRAGQSYCAGVIAAAGGDHSMARPLLEDATDLYAHCGARYEAACARLALAQTLAVLSRRSTAAHEAESAAMSFRELGAGFALGRAEAFQAVLEERQHEEDTIASSAVQPLGGLTPRETEVLRLVAQGLTNAEIAERLAGLEILDSIAWAHDRLLPWLEVYERVGSATVHPTCATRHLGLTHRLEALADLLGKAVVQERGTGTDAHEGPHEVRRSVS
jgi:ATP/maltotriose-dependent transcriptional regulator MalT